MLFEQASREFSLVVKCCAPPLFVEDETKIEAVDWQRVLRLAVRHRVSGLVGRGLAGHPDVPNDIRSQLAAAAAEVARSNLASLAGLAAIAKSMAAAGVPFTVHKGLPLGQMAYGSLTVRHSKDLDVTVEPAFVGLAETCLLGIGFRRTDLAGEAGVLQTAAWQQFRKHNEYVHSTSGVQVEVHWRESDNAYFEAPRTGEPRRVELVQGLKVTVPAEQDVLLELCLHGASHAWFRLKWIADVAALLAKWGPTETAAALLADARRHDLDRPVEQALLLCEALFPALGLRCQDGASRQGKWLARIAAEALLEEDVSAPAVGCAFVPRGLKRSRMFLRRSWAYRLQEVRLHATSPQDWQTMPLPARAQFLYPLLRLPLWVARRFGI